MFSQLIIGFMLESVMGPFRVAWLYLVSGMGGILFSSMIRPDEIAVGASTSIFGLFAAIVLIFLHYFS